VSLPVILSRADGEGSQIGRDFGSWRSFAYAQDDVQYPRQESLWRADGTRTKFCVYIMSNNSMTLYTGVTNELRRRVSQHKNGEGSEFTHRYHFDRLVYFESFDLIVDAIAREKSIKGWNRAKKIALVKTQNPTWRDLAVDFDTSP
jgi:putative endonuclease